MRLVLAPPAAARGPACFLVLGPEVMLRVCADASDADCLADADRGGHAGEHLGRACLVA